MTDGTETAARILRIAQRQFAERGYEAVGVQELCTEAGITKPTLYYHYGSKEGLLRAAIADARTVFLDSLLPFPDYSGDLVMDVRWLFHCFSAFADSEKVRFEIVRQMLFPPFSGTVRNVSTDDTHLITNTFTLFITTVAGQHGNLKGKEQFLAEILLGHALAFTGINGSVSITPDSPRTVLAAQTFLYGVF